MRFGLLLACVLLSGCALDRFVAKPPVIVCEGASLCDEPEGISGPNKLGATEPDDSANRRIATECARKHRSLVVCLRAYRAAGVILPKD